MNKYLKIFGLIAILAIALVYLTLRKDGLADVQIAPPKVLLWGAYVGDPRTNLSDFESLVGKKVNIVADFEGWGADGSFPSDLSSLVGQQGKTLLIFWEPNFGYDNIINGSQDSYIKQFALDAKNYSYPIILVPFDEMNLNEEAWGYGQNGNTPAKFVSAWQHVHDLFVGISNVKFAIDYNYQSVPDISTNTYGAYYPGNYYVDYVGLSGFNFGSPYLTFDQIFTKAASTTSVFGKPLYIFSTASIESPDKNNWISDGLGKIVKTYPKIQGWVWFNANKEEDWRVNSDSAALQSFKKVIP